jgi:non-specific serine/threonine protein kinase
LGDVYFIGQDQISGAMSSPRFDEQGLAATLYAIASGQSCRYGHQVISPLSLGLPKMLAKIIEAMLSDDPKTRNGAGDYFFKQLPYLKRMVMAKQLTKLDVQSLIPVWLKPKARDTIDTVVYGSRKSFLRESTSTLMGFSGLALGGSDAVNLEKGNIVTAFLGSPIPYAFGENEATPFL